MKCPNCGAKNAFHTTARLVVEAKVTATANGLVVDLADGLTLHENLGAQAKAVAKDLVCRSCGHVFHYEVMPEAIIKM